MRVIRQEAPEEIEVKCTGNGNGGGGCGAVLGIIFQDIYHTQSHSRDDSTDYATICCPKCVALTDVHSKIPGSWEWRQKKVVTPEQIKKLEKKRDSSSTASASTESTSIGQTTQVRKEKKAT